jgi:hypothetical protein
LALGLAANSSWHANGLHLWNVNSSEQMRLTSTGLGQLSDVLILGPSWLVVWQRQTKFGWHATRVHWATQRAYIVWPQMAIEGYRWRITTLARLTSTGLGIGTSSPLTRLNPQADSTNPDLGQLVISGATNANKRLSLGFQTTGNYGFVQSLIAGDNYYPLVLQPNGGNVGIGTSNPGAKLDIVGATSNKFVLALLQVSITELGVTPAMAF